MRKLPTQSHLREWFDYDPKTGIFVWRKEPKKIGTTLGKRTGTPNDEGYIKIRVPNFGLCSAHRMAWIYIHGEMPEGVEIDHIDRNPSNNAIANLRLATKSQNCQNRGAQTGSKSGLKGAHYCSGRNGKKWRSLIMLRGKHIFLGYFHTPEEAHAAYISASQKYFAEFSGVR